MFFKILFITSNIFCIPIDNVIKYDLIFILIIQKKKKNENGKIVKGNSANV